MFGDGDGRHNNHVRFIAQWAGNFSVYALGGR